MPWTTPTLKEVRKMTRDYVLGQLGARTMIANSVTRILADCQAALTHLNLQYIDWLALQLLPLTAETEWLDRHATIWLKNADGSKGRKAATFAEGTVLIDGTNGVIVPIGSLLTSRLGISFETTEEITIGDDPTNVNIRALLAGTTGNLDDDDVLSLDDPIVGVEAITNVDVDGGVDEETDDQLRERVLQRIQNPPMGGAAHDYVRWALEVPGVTRAWAASEMGIGTVTVRFVMDDIYPDNYGIPTEDDIQTVFDYIETKRPVSIEDFFVVAPIPVPYSLTITGLSKNDTATQAAIEAALERMDRVKSKPGQTMYRAWVDEAISGATGEVYHELVFTTQVMPNAGSMPVLGTITYGT